MVNQRQNFSLFRVMSILAIVISLFAFYYSRKAYQYTTTIVTLEEHNSLLSPVYDENNGKWSYVAIYELSLMNEGMKKVVINRIAKVSEGSGFFVALKDGKIINQGIQHSSYIVEPTISEIRTNPKLLSSIDQDFGDSKQISIIIKPGETKLVRIGTSISAYDSEKQNLADMVLLSYEIRLATGQRRLFRQAVRIITLSSPSQ